MSNKTQKQIFLCQITPSYSNFDSDKTLCIFFFLLKVINIFSSFYWRLIRVILIGFFGCVCTTTFYMSQYNNHSVLACTNSTLLFFIRVATVILIENSIKIYRWKILYKFQYFQQLLIWCQLYRGVHYGKFYCVWKLKSKFVKQYQTTTKLSS